MTDPGWADRTYLEPLDPEGVRAVLERERPDALLPTLGGQTALNLASELHQNGTLAELGIELIGASFEAIHRAEDREAFAATMASIGLRVPKSVIATSRRAGMGGAARGRHLAAGGDPAGVHAGRARRRLRLDPRRVRGDGRHRPAREPDRAGAGGGVGGRLGRVRAGGDPRPAGQRGDRVLDREHRPDGRAHRRLGHRGAGPDAVRPRVPDPARRLGRGDPGGRRGDRRLQRAVRAQPRHRRAGGDRDEPARVAVIRAGLQGHRLPDRQGGHQAGHRLHAGRDPQRHHPHDAGRLRADAGLRGGQAAPVRVREVPRRRHRADHPDEVGGRGDGHRPHLRRVVGQGPAQPRARPPAAPRRPGRRPRVGPLRPHPGPADRRRAGGRAGRRVGHPPLVRGRVGADRPRRAVAALDAGRLAGRDRLAAAEGDGPVRRAHRRAVRRGRGGRAGRPPAAGRAPGVQGRGQLRRRGGGPGAVLLLGLRAGGRAARAGARERDHPGRGPQPDRPGHRVRLLLRAGRADLPRAWATTRS